MYAESESVVSRYPKSSFRDQGPRHAREHPPNGTGIPARNFFTGQPNKQATTSTRRDLWGRSQKVQDIRERDQRREGRQRTTESRPVPTSETSGTAPGKWGSRDVRGRGMGEIRNDNYWRALNRDDGQSVAPGQDIDSHSAIKGGIAVRNFYPCLMPQFSEGVLNHNMWFKIHNFCF